MSEKERAKLSETKEKCGRAHTQVSEVVEYHKDSKNGIYMLVNHKAKQHKEIHPTRIYLDKFSTYNHMYNEELLIDVREGNTCIFRNCNAGNTSNNRRVSFGSIECWLKK